MLICQCTHKPQLLYLLHGKQHAKSPLRENVSEDRNTEQAKDHSVCVRER